MKNLSEEGHTTADNKTPVSVTPRDSDENRKNPEKRRSSDIAIIGLSGRFAGSPNLEAFWSHLQKGQSCIMPIRREGWEQHSNLDPTCVPPSQEFRGGMLEHIDRFDPFFFNISPLEATRMDPQQRLFLEEAYKAFEDAGYSAEQLSNKKVGVFVGARASDYQEQALRRDSAGILSGASRLSGIDAHLFLGNDMAILAARVSYFLNCKGPSLTIDTTSSSSLVAVHLACENIRTGESEMALAGGVFVLSSPYFYLMTAKTNALSPDGVCRTFDNAANGIVLGEGVGAIVLKPLERALADGDHIHGVILGSAINQDGKTFGITAPSQLSQKALLTDLYKKAAIHPETVSYIEAHGTGTKLGDPIEMKALTEAFRDFTDKRQFCAVGSLKPNIGHTIMSAGIAGLLKILLAMKYQQIPPTIHLEQVNQQIDVESSPFFINTELKEWQRCDASPRRAGISSFGFSGTNCHVILEEPPLQKPRTQKQTRPYAFFPFSAKTKAALMQKVEDMVKWLETEGETYSVEDISYTLVQGRSHFSMRSAVVARDRSDLLHALRAIQSQGGSGHDIEQEKDKSKRPESVLHTSGHELLQELRDNGSLAQEDYREKLLRLAGLYMQGECLDWGQLFAKGRKFRVPLPTYPFRGESYWIETTEEESRPLMENLSQRLRKSHQQVQKVPLDTERGVQEKEKLHEALSRVVSDLLRVRVEEIDPQTPLSEYGFDSITFTEFANRLNMTYDLHVTPPLFYEHSTISRLAQYVQATSSSALATHLAEASPQAGTQRDLTPRPVTTDEVPSTMNNPMVTTISIHDACAAHALMPEKQAYTATSPVAIIGMSGVFPQAPDVESLWSNLLAGRDCIGEIPPSRWDWQTCFRNRTTKEHSTNVKWAGIVENVELFDPQFFGISPREAEQMDPQQRLLMTYVWKAIEDAGYDASSLSGSNTALFVGMINSGYSERLSQAGKAIESYSSTCQVPSVGPGRMSYFLNLHGPSEVIEAACSSSLVAIHRGVNAIESGECHIAIVGGVNTLISPELHISFSKAGMLSPDGCCKAFSASANGYVRSEGVGMLVLKKLSDAEQASDHIYGVIRGSAENHGGRATSLTAPNPRAQADVLITAYRKAGIDPRTVGYIEAHGTGTVLGDPIEINGLKTAFSELRTGARPCPSDNQEEPIPQAWCGVGSVKSNIGHLEWAAGVAGVIKVLLQLQHKKLVKSLHCEQINPYIELKGSPFYVVQENREWEALRDHAGNILPRRAGVSSFGFGGVNAHVVLEEYVPRPQASRQVSSMEPGAIIVLSAKNEERLNAQVQQLLAWVQTITSPDEPLGPAQELSRTPSLQDLAYTLQVGRSSMEERLAMQVSSFADLVEKLQRFLQEPQKAGDWYRGQTKQHKETVDLFEDDEELQEAIDKWLKRGKYKKLLQGWVKGLSIDWKLLYTGGTGSERGPGSARDTIPTAVPALPHRISLPTYPFAQERYWIPTVQGIQATDETADLPRPSISLSGLAQPPSQSRSNAVVVPELAPMLPEASSASAQGTIAATNVQMASLVDSGRFKEARTPVAQGLQSTTVPQLEEELVRSLAQALYIEEDDIDVDERFVDMGLDSVIGVEWIESLNKQYASNLKASSVYDHPTIRQLAHFLEKQVLKHRGGRQQSSLTQVQPTTGVSLGSAQGVISTEQEEQVCVAPEGRLQVREDGASEKEAAGKRTGASPAFTVLGRKEAIAIVGMSGKYPGARNLTGYWDNLVQGKNGVQEVPLSRWDISDYYDPSSAASGKMYCKWLGTLDEIEYFDPLFFHLSPAEAEVMDPQQRLFLEEGYKAFEDAGYSPGLLSSGKCGVYLGIASHEYDLLLHQYNAAETDLLGTSSAIAAARIAYLLNLKGPAIAIDTACSSSLVATHLACQALWNREIDMALVGGVNLCLTPGFYAQMCAAGMLSPDGQCRTFDKGANGFVPGEGVGALVLKRLAEAEVDHDQIYGVIIGSGINQDGATNGMTAPSVKSQIDLVREIYEKYAIDPESISYVEMHGTGTKLGDPIELQALATVFQEKTQRKQYCAIGSVKTNIGHTLAAAGVASLQKVLLAMKEKKLVPTLHFEQPNPHFDFETSPFYVHTCVQDWKSADGMPQHAAVSSFGFSGTNAHLVIEEYIPGRERTGDSHSSLLRSRETPSLFVLSAKSEHQLKSYAQEMKQWIQAHVELALADIAFTLQLGREAMDHRLAIVTDSRELLLQRLEEFVENQTLTNVYTAQVKKGTNDVAIFEEDSDGQSLLHIWCQKRNLTKIAQVWVRGVNIDWKLLYKLGGGSAPRTTPIAAPTLPHRISLPTYPFARERYWIPIEACRDTDGGKPAPRPMAALTGSTTPFGVSWQTGDRRTADPLWSPTGYAALHPLVQRNTSTLWEQRFSSTFHGDEFFLADHVIFGQRIMPGVAHLEIAHAAVALACGRGNVWSRTGVVGRQTLACPTPQAPNSTRHSPQASANATLESSILQLSNIVWSRPLICDPAHPVTMHIILEEQDNGTIAFLISREGEQAQGDLRAADPDLWHKTHRRELSLQSLPTEEETEGTIYSRGIAEWHPHSGSSLDLSALQARCQQQIAVTQLYQHFRELGFGYGPAFLGIEELRAGEGEGLARLRLPAEVTQSSPGFVLHPGLLDASLQCCLGLFAAPVGTAKKLQVPFALATLTIIGEVKASSWAWVRQRQSSATGQVFDVDLCDDTGRIAVQMHGLSIRPFLTEETRTVLLTPTWKEATITSQSPSEEAPLPIEQLASSSPLVLLCDLPHIEASHLHAKLPTGAQCRSLTVGTGLAPVRRSRRERRFQEAVWRLIEEFQHLLQGQADTRASTPAPLLVQVVVADIEEPSLLSALTGVLRTAEQEYPKLWGQLIEVEGTPEAEELLALLHQSQIYSPQERHMRYRGGKLWVREWQELHELSALTSIPWKEGGCYLISGGTGGLARLFVQEIARHVQEATILLVGRSALEVSQYTQLAPRANDSHIHIDYQQVDVSDGEAVHALIQRALQQYGHLDGIIHAAGVLRDSLLINKTQDEVQAVLAPKVCGGELLDEASRELPLDFFILCSSLSAVMGNVGQADYAAANAYLDAFAYARQAQVLSGERQGTTVSINWPLWEEGGMQIEAGVRQTMRRRLGVEVMETETGMKILSQALGSGVAQVVVAYGQVERIKQRLASRFLDLSVGMRQEPRAAPLDGRQAQGTTLSLERLREALKSLISHVLKVRAEEIDTEKPLSEYGFDSLTSTRFANYLNQTYSGPVSRLDLTAPIFFQHSTIERLAQYLQANYAAVLAPHFAALSSVASGGYKDSGSRPMTTEERSSVVPVTRRRRRMAKPLMRGSEEQAQATPSPIAIIGMSGIFPQAPDVQSLWHNLLEGRDCISEMPPERRDWLTSFGNSATANPNKTNITRAGLIEGIELFDPLFFGISGAEAEQMDPQQRLLMMYVWKAIEDAGYSAESLSGTNTALFVGTINSGYCELVSRSHVAIEGYSSTSQVPSVGPNRMSYFLNLHGPSEPIETACSSSLIAIHRGVNALESGQCAIAIVGGVNTLISPELHISFSKAGMLSPDGRCKTFSAEANGYVRGEGVGMLVLKRLDAAEQAGDHIYGVIRGSAENHGGRASSFMAPNPRAQADLLLAAYHKAGIDPRTVGYIEAHGTGTPLGDPIEINGLKMAWSELAEEIGEGPIQEAWCGIGSVKSNIGHLELAAGVAGVIKVVLQLQHKKLVKSLHCEQINPYIELKDSPFYVVQEARDWEAQRDQMGNALPRRAGISSFGFGGANAHVVLEEYVPKPQAPRKPRQTQFPALIVLSAKNEERLGEQVRQLLIWVRGGTCGEEVLLDLAYTLQVGREAMEERLAFQVSSLQELEEKLLRYIEEAQDKSDLYRGQIKHYNLIRSFAADEDGQKAIAAWMSKGKYEKLLDLWVKGLTIDWKQLYGEHLPRRISLPTYPFAQKRYWIPAPTSSRMSSNTSAFTKASVDLQPWGVSPLSIAQPTTSSKTNGNGEASDKLERIALRPLADQSEPSVMQSQPDQSSSQSRSHPEVIMGASSSVAQDPQAATNGQPTLSAQVLEEELASSLAQALYLEPSDIDVEKLFGDLGLDSVVGVEWIRSLNKQYASNLKVTCVYDYSTIRQLAGFLQKELLKRQQIPALVMSTPAPFAPMEASPVPDTIQIRTNESIGTGLTPVREMVGHSESRADRDRPAMRERLGANPVHQPLRKGAIALVGMSGKYPDARNLHEYWENLVQAKDCVHEIPRARFDVSDYYDKSPTTPGKIYCKELGALEGIEYFDPSFFHLSPAEAEEMDPQQRLFLEEGYKAFEDAGYSPGLLSNRKCGVYLGIMSHEYELLLSRQNALATNILGTNPAIAAARIAYLLNLKGPAIAINTACSSSLVATHLACQALRNQEIDMALVGGVSLYLTPESYIGMCAAGMLSPDGRCKTCDISANGFVPAEGVGALVLKRLADAEADHDQISGVIIGSGINQDGATNGMTAPSVKSQIELLREIYEKYEIDPESMSYVEMHGTGTALGDPIELEALATVFQEKTQRKQYCAIGSVKSNIGHTSAAAGLAGVHKVLLAIRQKKLVPSLHFERPNPHFDFEASPFYVNTTVRDWQSEAGTKRRAAVSSFGYSGTNAHLVLEEYIPAGDRTGASYSPDAPLEDRTKTPSLFVLSARTEQQLKSYAQEMKRWIQAHSELALADIAFTLQLGREAMEYRLAIEASSRELLLQRLDSFVKREASPGLYTAQVKKGRNDVTLFEKDSDGQSLLHIWCQKKKLAKIAQVWVEGVKVDWRLLYGESLPYRISLPTYPFTGKRYWVPTSASSTIPSVSGWSRPTSHTTLHPLVQHNTSTLWEQRFSSTFCGDEFFLADHIVKGEHIMPGVAYLEMARAAVTVACGWGQAPTLQAPQVGTDATGEAGCLCLSHVVWARPLVCDPAHPVTAQITLTPQDGGTISFVVSRAAGQGSSDGLAPQKEGARELLYCQGTAQWRAENTVEARARPRLDLAAVQARCQHQIPVASCYQRYRELGLDYGPTFQAIEQLSVGEGEVLARFRLPIAPGVAHTQTDFVLHPSLLDAALHASIGLMIKQNEQVELRIPFALDELLIEGSMPAQGWTWIRRNPGSATGSFDTLVCDDAGHVMVRVHGLSARPLPPQEETQTRLLIPNWIDVTIPGQSLEHPSPIRAVEEGLAPSLILLCDLPGILASRLQAQISPGGHCRSLISSQSRRELRFQDAVVQLIQELQHLQQSKPVGPVLVQVVVAQREEPSLLSALAGVLKVAQQEYPKLRGQLIEVEGKPEEGELLIWLREDQLRIPHEQHIRYRDGKRWVRQWQEPSTPTLSQKLPWKEGGCYLISGGAGGLAQLFVQEIAQRVREATVLLVGRSALSQEKLAQLEKARGSGIHIDYQQVDVSDEPAVHALIQRVLTQSGHLNGIIHAAGVVHESLLPDKTQEEVQAVLSPKVRGVEHLDEASSEIPLDFFLLCSSLSAVMGGVGLTDYAGANAYLDAFAHARRAKVQAGERQGATLSINWPYWEAGGMQMKAETIDMMQDLVGEEPMGTEIGMKTLYQALASGFPQVVVLHGQVERIKQLLIQGPESPVGTAPLLERTLSYAIKQEPQTVTSVGQEPPGQAQEQQERASAYFKKQLAAVIKVPVQQIDAEAELSDYGFDSIMAMRFTNALEGSFGPLSKTLLFEHPTIHSVTEYFLHNYHEQVRSVLRMEEAPVTTLPEVTQRQAHALHDPSQTAPFRFGSRPDQHLGLFPTGACPMPQVPATSGPAQQDEAVRVGDIAIIGMAGRYPGARNLQEFWENLRNGRDCITEIPPERWDHRLYFDTDKNNAGTTYSKWGGFLDGVDEFDPLFFSISPQEAEMMDPQERLFLECAFATLEDAGYTREGLSRYQDNGSSYNVGVFVGVMYEEYQLFGAEAQREGRPLTVSGSSSSVANRVSYFCNFHGPSLAVDTACSSSLTAIHLACRSIQCGDCELAIAGGVNVSIHPNKYLFLGQNQFVSSQGHCESFGVGADGYVPAEGVGAVLLKPRAQAETDGDHIYAVIKATAINHGGKTNGYTVPNPHTQAEVIKRALKDAEIDPRTISYIEAHGTGTQLGDPIEIAGLARAFGDPELAPGGTQDNVATGLAQDKGTSPLPTPTAPRWCAIGSVKSNIGHAESAAGIAGITKVLLQMRYGQLVPSLHAKVLNPHIDFSATPFVVQQELSEWKRPQVQGQEVKRCAGISAFGAGGSNAHVVLEEYVERKPTGQEVQARPSRPALIVLSARTEEQLHERARQLLNWIQEKDCSEEPVEQGQDYRFARSLLDNLAYTLQVGREVMEERLALQVNGLSELAELLCRYLQEPQEVGDWYRGQAKQYKEIMALFSSDEELQDAIGKWLQRGKYEKLLALWVKGLKIPWQDLYGEQRPKRISLPTYPFARERYWIPTPARVRQHDLSIQHLPTGTAETRTLLLTPNWIDVALPKGRSSGETSLTIQHLVLLCDLSDVLAARIQAQMALSGRSRSLHSSQSLRELHFQDVVVQLIQELQHALQSRSAGPMLVQVVVAQRERPSFLEALDGVLKTVQQEYPKLRGQLIEVDGEPEEEELLVWLRENQRLLPHEPRVRYSCGKRWVRQWQEHPEMTTPLSVPWKEGGCYLISGGAGGLARLFVQEIAQKLQEAIVVLVGRSVLSVEQRTRLESSQSSGIRIDYRQADISDGPAVDDLIKKVLAQYGHLDGIIHAAGVLHDSLLLNKTQEGVQEVLSPKVAGVERLDEASKHLPLDFFVLCSSGTAVVGNVGQADYAAANAYLDAFAHARQAQVLAGQRYGATLSINWPYWEEGGMQIETEAMLIMQEQQGLEAMSTQTGMKSFYQALALRQAQVMVLHGDLPKAREQFFSPTSQDSFSPMQAKASSRLLPEEPRTKAQAGEQEELRQILFHQMRVLFAEVTKLSPDEIDADEPLENYGIDSRIATRLTQKFRVHFRDFPRTFLYEYPTFSALGEYLLESYPQKCLQWIGQTSQVQWKPKWSSLPAPLPAQTAPIAEKQSVSHPTSPAVWRATQTSIAIIGISGRYPQATNLEEYWEVLKAGQSCITEIPRSRWHWRDSYQNNREEAIANGKSYSKWGAFLDNFDQFDPLFFQMAPRDAEEIDPQERLFLEECWKALEDAGYAPSSLPLYLRQRTGVFGGITKQGFHFYSAETPGQFPSTSFASLVNRVSYYLNLQGPSTVVDTMCSSALVAIHEACEYIRQGKGDMALAGGVNLYLHPSTYISLSRSQMIADTRKSAAFGKGGHGFVPGEGVGVIVLKAYDQAVKDGDGIYAVIRGSAVNHNGKTSGYTTPDPQGQAAVIQQALSQQGLDPRTISYIEAAASGSERADSVEMAALTRVFGACEREQEDYKIGSVKPTFGHSEAASGMAQLTKVILSLKQQMLVPTAVPKDFKPVTPFHEWPFQLQREVSPWKRLTVDGVEVPRRAGITSIGASGVNAHLIAEEYIPETETTYQSNETNTPIVFVLSAKNTERLLEYVRQWIVYLQQHQNIDLENVAYTLQIGREEMPCRLAFVAHNQEELVQQLEQWIGEQKGTDGCPFREISTDESKHQMTAPDDLHEKALVWVAGNTVLWNDLHKGKHRTRITGLPTYPFKRRTCWIDCHQADYSRTECAPEEYTLPLSRQKRENSEGELHEND